jgi:hypothetical protein
MSNDVTLNPLALDSASASTVLVTENFLIYKIIWNSGSSGVAGDQCVLKDKLDNIIFDVTIEASKETRSEDFFPALTANGLKCTTLSHGIVYIYYQGPAPLKTS